MHVSLNTSAYISLIRVQHLFAVFFSSEVKFTCKEIHKYLVYISWILTNSPTCLTHPPTRYGTLPSSQKILSFPFQSILAPRPQKQLLFFFLFFFFYHRLMLLVLKRHINGLRVWTVLCRAIFPHPSVLGTCPCHAMCRWFVPLRCWVVLRCVTKPQFVHQS